MCWMKHKKFMKMGSFSSKIAKFDAQRSLRAGLLTSLETRCGAHPSSLRTSAIQTIFKVPSICIIMRIISENDDRTTRFACVRPSTVSTTRKTPIVSMALRHHRRAAVNHQALQMVHPALHARMCRPQYFAQRTPTCNSAAYHVDVLIRRPLAA